MERELEQLRKKYTETNQEKLAAFESLESYQQIFTKCEQSLIKLQSEKEAAERACEAAVRQAASLAA